MARLTTLFATLLAALSVYSSRTQGKPGRARVPGAYIFELEDNEDTASFYTAVNSEGKTRMKLDYQLFKGVSVQLNDIDNAEDKAVKIAASSPSVKNLWPVELYSIPEPIVSWAGVGALAHDGPAIRKRDNDSVTTSSPNIMTQVDKLRAEGITGKDVNIAVIDTGVDYNHPALGGCFGKGCLVSFGTDLVGDTYNGFNEPVPDPDPMDCQGHGTHVSGIIAAQKNELGFTGAAPEANLGIYKVFGCSGEAGSDVLIAAFNQAFEDGADIITASICGLSGWADDAWALAVTRIVDQGTPCTLAAGNDGDSGLFYASTAANGRRSTAVASFDNTESPTPLYLSEFAVDGGEADEFGYAPASPSAWGGVKLPLWAPNRDPAVSDGGCDPYPDDTPELSEYIVLVRRGTCPFAQKAENAVAYGAKYLLVYNNEPGAVSFEVSTVPGILAAAMVTPDVGENWIKLLAADSKVTLNVTGTEHADTTVIYPINNVTGGAPSTFTSWGPTWDVDDVKPTIGAPGGNILSTYPLDRGGYAVMSGTSMACPLVAAVYALVSEVRGTLDPTTMQSILSPNADPQLFNDGTSFSSFLAPVSQQGGGIIRAHDAAHATTFLEPSSFSFGDSANSVQVANLTLRNTGKEAITYEVSHVPTVSMYTLEAGSIYPAVFPNEAIHKHASLSFSEDEITLASGDSITVQVAPAPPSGLHIDRLPVWSGWVAVNGSDGTSLSLPYQGVSGSLRKHIVLDPEDSWVSISGDEQLNPVARNATFTLPAPGSQAGPTGLPTVVAYLALGTTQLRADIVPLKTNSTERVKGFFGTKMIGQPQGFPLTYLPRGLNSARWGGKLDDGKFASPGRYKFVLRALRITGDPENEDDWDVSETAPFWIKYD